MAIQKAVRADARKNRISRYDTFIGIPLEAELKREISAVAKSEERDMTSMARVLLKEALAARRSIAAA